MKCTVLLQTYSHSGSVADLIIGKYEGKILFIFNAERVWRTKIFI